jgi:hypothetical protein
MSKERMLTCPHFLRCGCDFVPPPTCHIPPPFTIRNPLHALVSFIRNRCRTYIVRLRTCSSRSTRKKKGVMPLLTCKYCNPHLRRKLGRFRQTNRFWSTEFHHCRFGRAPSHATRSSRGLFSCVYILLPCATATNKTCFVHS